MFQISYFESARDNLPKPVDADWNDLVELLGNPRVTVCTPETCKRAECEYKHGPAWSPASYPEGSTRARNAVISVCVLVLDVDHIEDDEQLLEILGKLGYRRIVHSSHSDKPGDRCVRIVIALSRPVTNAEWPIFWKNVTDIFQIPADPATKDASRLYFLPSRPNGSEVAELGDGTDYLFVHNDGPALDVESVLNVEPDAQTGADSDVGVIPTSNGRDAALQLLAQHWPTEGRHLASLALTGALAHAKWSTDQISDFLHDLMGLVYGEGKDPNPRKREEQAASSVAKVERGEPVAGWPSLIPHVGEETVQVVTQSLNIGNSKTLLATLLGSRKPQKPTLDEVRANLKAKRSELLRKKTNIDAQYEAKTLGKLLDHDQVAEGTEDRQDALVRAIRTTLKYAPPNSTNDQLVQFLIHIFPVNVGQEPDRPWADVLLELLDQCAETLAQEAAEEEEFEVEISGKRLGKPQVTPRNYRIALKKLDVKLKYDLFACKKLISRQGSPWEVVEDHHVDDVWFKIEEQWDMQWGYEKFSKYLTAQAFMNAFHPVRDYLDSLEWDGVPRITNWLHAYGGAPDNEYTQAVGRLVLVAAVRRARKPGSKFDEMLILEGEQGKAKSTALQALCPNVDWFTDDMPLGEDSKRVIEATAGKWIVEGSELKGMSPKKIVELKGFLSRCIDEARMAFGREVKISPRQWIVIGTTNDAQYLHDPTGLRRFWPVAITAFDVAAILRDRDQIWAEAAHYEAQGESIRLAEKYYAIAAAEQEERRVVDTIEAVIEEVFEGFTGKIKCSDIYQLLGKDAVDATHDEQRRVGEAMRRNGWKHTKRRIGGKPTYVYVKGDPAEQEIMLGVTGRKVIRATGAQGTHMSQSTVQAKVN